MSHTMLPLTEAIRSRGGSVDPAKFQDEAFDLFSIPAYDSQEPEQLHGREIGSTKQLVQEGDVLLSKIVPHIRRCWIVGPNRGKRQIASSEWIIFRSEQLDTGYLRHVLLSDFFHQQFMRTVSGVGGSLLRARPSEVAKITIPCPDLEQQKQIAAILDKAEGIRRQRREALELADKFLRATFLEMFGDPLGNPKGFPVGTIRNVVSEVRYGTSAKADETQGQYPILRMNNLTYSGRMDLTDLKFVDIAEEDRDKYLAQAGDLLFNRTNSKELVGKTAVYREEKPMAIAGYLIRVRTNDKANTSYLSGYLNSAHGKLTLSSMCKSIVGMANINAQELQDIKILIPPRELQDRYEKIVLAVEAKRALHQKAEADANELFEVLSHQLLAS